MASSPAFPKPMYPAMRIRLDTLPIFSQQPTWHGVKRHARSGARGLNFAKQSQIPFSDSSDDAPRAGVTHLVTERSFSLAGTSLFVSFGCREL